MSISSHTSPIPTAAPNVVHTNSQTHLHTSSHGHGGTNTHPSAVPTAKWVDIKIVDHSPNVLSPCPQSPRVPLPKLSVLTRISSPKSSPVCTPRLSRKASTTPPSDHITPAFHKHIVNASLTALSVSTSLSPQSSPVCTPRNSSSSQSSPACTPRASSHPCTPRQDDDGMGIANISLHNLTRSSCPSHCQSPRHNHVSADHNTDISQHANTPRHTTQDIHTPRHHDTPKDQDTDQDTVTPRKDNTRQDGTPRDMTTTLVQPLMASTSCSSLPSSLFPPTDPHQDILIAVHRCRGHHLAALLQTYPQLTEIRDLRGYTPLMLASMNDWSEGVKLLIAAGSHVNAVDRYGNTSLMMAAMRGSVDSLRLLLQAKADVDIINADGNNVFMIADTPRYATVDNDIMALLFISLLR